jgi:protein-tyrosine phosphatase
MKKILFVCLGNICRSPAAEGVFLHLLAEKKLLPGFLVDSAGTVGNHIGELPDPRTRKSALKRGIALTSHARKLEAVDLKNFDFILCMDKSNVEKVKLLDPDSLYQDKIKLFTDYRLELNFTEVPDPYWGSELDFDQVMDIVSDACKGFFEKECK